MGGWASPSGSFSWTSPAACPGWARPSFDSCSSSLSKSQFLSSEQFRLKRGNTRQFHSNTMTTSASASVSIFGVVPSSLWSSLNSFLCFVNNFEILSCEKIKSSSFSSGYVVVVDDDVVAVVIVVVDAAANCSFWKKIKAVM